MMILQSVQRFVAEYRLTSPGDRILVAVSGGPDSVALLHILFDMREEFGLQLEVAHLQHGIRGEEAKEEARFVANLAAQFGLPFHLTGVNLPLMKTAAGKGNIEALAREQRYRFFAEVAHQRGLNKIATAHTQDDQAETMLMWLLRGAGRKGLGGMRPMHRLAASQRNGSDGIAVIRPLLEISKAEILEFLQDRQIEYRIDRTNQDTKLLRNWIRLELLPQLRERIDGNISARLADQAKLLHDEDVVLEDLAQAALAGCLRAEELDRAALLQEPVAMRRRMLRGWIAQRRGSLRAVDFAHVDGMLNLIATGPSQGRLALPGGWELVREYDKLRLEKRSRKLKRHRYSYELKVGEVLQIPEAGVELHSERIVAPVDGFPADLTAAVFDRDRLPSTLMVRNFRDGDRFQPLGIAGHKKLKDLFIDRKIPLSTRANLPLLVLGDEILWIPGYGRSSLARVTPATRSVIRIKVVPLGT